LRCQGGYGSLNALGIEILAEAVLNYKYSLYSPPPPRNSSKEAYILRIPPALRVSLGDIAASEARTLKVVVERMLREGVEKRLVKAEVED
jgi:hypothetical protein